MALDSETWYNIRRQIAGQGLGGGSGVVCSECMGSLDGERAKAYIIGKRDRWKASRILHPDCSTILVEDRVGDHNEQEGIVYGDVQFAPEIGPQTAEERKLAKAKWKKMFGGEATVIDSSLPKHHLTNLELGRVHIPGKGTFSTVAEQGADE